ncbi:MAG TPA: MMPL family transporter [Nocardioidaceae bacterium]|nr:MMPL family transporter [Nocardioidaceae bacterium]
MSKAVDTVRDRTRWWLWPLLVVLVWLVVGGPLGSFAGRLSEVQTNDNAAFLPEGAESTKVLEWQSRFSDQELLPAVVVYEDTSGLGPDALPAIQSELEAVAEIEGVLQVSPPIPSQDGEAVQAVVAVDAGLGDGIGPVVEQVRAELSESALDADVYVTGPAGVLADFIEAFGAIDGLLLLVALAVVLVILLIVYRSPILPFLVLLSSLLALAVGSTVIYLLADNDVLDLNGQSQGILFVLVVGASTDYALLLVSRFREELREHESRVTSMRMAYRGVVEPIVASGVTVMLGLMCLLLSDLSSNQSLGPIAAIGIAGAMLSALTFLPAALVLLGRGAYWPFRPTLGSEHPESSGLWGRVARLVGRRARATWVVATLALLAAAAFFPTFKDDGVPQSEVFLTDVGSVLGQEAISRHFEVSSGNSAVVIGPATELQDMLETISSTEGVASAMPVTEPPGRPDAEPRVVAGRVEIEAQLSAQPYSEAAQQTVRELRERLDAVSANALVGGQTAIQVDTLVTTTHDRNRIIPAILLVVFVVLAVLLRSLLAPLLLVLANLLSFGATLGVSALVFNHVFGFPGADPSITLFGFVFLIALGIDYSIFLMTRAREEALRQGTRPGMLRALASTGGVITSAGIVLAATFTALGVVPLLFLAQIAFVVAFGVLLDTFVVRSLLVPALSHDIGHRIWWPSRLGRAVDGPRHRR